MPVSQKTKNTQSGFTLVELLVAVVILAVGLLALAQLQVTAIKTNAQSATSTAAVALAQKIVEEIAALDADDAMFDAPSSGFLTWDGSPVEMEGAGTYNITYEVNVVEPDPSDSTITISNLYQINIRIESTTDVMHVLGNKRRVVTAATLKRAI
ncbi:MAG: type IV pilus modification protein PilV [Deltaproteobacteria bacterium]|nr:type IV pilus modification protein PilV [Deltaproteobacteria bacterium]